MNQAVKQQITTLNQKYPSKQTLEDSLSAVAGANAAADGASKDSQTQKVNTCRPELVVDTYAYLFSPDKDEVRIRSDLTSQKKEPGGALKRAYERPPMEDMVEILLGEQTTDCEPNC